MLGYPEECHHLCAVRRAAKSRDIPRKVINCVPSVGRQESWDIPKCVTTCVPIEGQ